MSVGRMLFAAKLLQILFDLIVKVRITNCGRWKFQCDDQKEGNKITPIKIDDDIHIGPYFTCAGFD